MMREAVLDQELEGPGYCSNVFTPWITEVEMMREAVLDQELEGPGILQ